MKVRGVDATRYGGQFIRRFQQIESLLEGLSPDELLALIEHIARRLRLREERKLQPLYGISRGKFPEDADINAILKEARHLWQRDFEEFEE